MLPLPHVLFLYFLSCAASSSGIVRLHGFAPAHASVEVVRMVYGDDGRFFEVVRNNRSHIHRHRNSSNDSNSDGNNNDNNDDSNHNHNNDDDNTIPTSTYANEVEGMLAARLPMILRFEFLDFVVGRDGACCVMHNGTTTTCLIRTMR